MAISHGALSIAGLASERIDPSDGSGAGIPQPRKESVDSAITAERKTETACMMMYLMIPGRIWKTKILMFPAPTVRDAVIYSSLIIVAVRE